MNTFDNHSEFNGESSELKKTALLDDMYQNWFLDYASYVILERAVPDLKDGLKPVQRRLMHSMKELDDGRYNKVANIIGNTMKYHPHGDASIGDALVQIGQKDLLIDTQGNWGNLLTGDNAAAPRYIEARLSKFALDIVFNPKTTTWKASYDGRNKEPLTLPVKFPLLLAQGSDGIAVGLASKILPHNFIELIDACIKHLKDEPFVLYPDFPTAGMADFSKYNDGLRGGRVKIRARIVQVDKKTLTVTELPYGKTTGSLIDSIISANDRGKIKIRKIEDNTSDQVEINIHLAQGISPDQTIDALYAFTDCETSISPNSCVIDVNKPRFLSATELLEISNKNTLDLLKLELTIKREELLESLFFSSLERIFIEKRIYRNIEKCETWEDVINTIDIGLEKYKKQFYREVTRDDIIKLTEIKIKRISRYDTAKNDDYIKSLEEQLAETDFHLAHLIQYAIDFYTRILEKYGKGKERKTEIRNFDTIEASKVAVANEKLYVNRVEGFAGTALKKDEYVSECSDIDDIIAIREDGTCIITRVADKVFLGKNIIHIAVFNRNDDRTIYNMIYHDGSKSRAMVKRFAILGVQRDKEYKLIKGNKLSKVLYMTANPNGEAEVVTVHLKPKPRLKTLHFDYDFSMIEIKNKTSPGLILSKNPVRKILLKEEGISTLSAKNIWYDDIVKKLNTDGRGLLLGSFSSDDKIISFNKSGTYKLTGYEITTHFDDDMFLLIKYRENITATTIYFDNETQSPYIKRFTVEYSDKKINFIGEDINNSMMFFTINHAPEIKITYPENPRRKTTEELIPANDFIGVKSYKAKGKRLTTQPYTSIEVIEAEALPEEVIIEENNDMNASHDDTSDITVDETTEITVEQLVEPVIPDYFEIQPIATEQRKKKKTSEIQESVEETEKPESLPKKKKGKLKIYLDEELKSEIEAFVKQSIPAEESKEPHPIAHETEAASSHEGITDVADSESITLEEKAPTTPKKTSKKPKKIEPPASGPDLFSQFELDL